MYHLMTKEQRQNAREAWINGKVTEKYKDIEILSQEKYYSGSVRFELVIWRGNAGKPHVNYLFRSMEQVKREINQEKRYADNREQYKKEHADNRGRVLTQAAKASQKIKEILKREYPLVKFSVRSSNFANGNSVDISWIDGIPTKEIDAFANQFQYGHFDGMTDCYEHSNTRDFPQAKFVHCTRSISPEKRDQIRKELAKLMSIEDTDYAVIPKDYEVNVRGYAYNPPLSALVYQIAVDFDFSKGFTGVRNRKSETGSIITNMFELY